MRVGRESHARGIVHSLFEGYLSVEELFSDSTQADVIERLRLHSKKDFPQGCRHSAFSSELRGSSRRSTLEATALVISSLVPDILALKASQLEQTKLSELRSSIARSLSELEMFTEEGDTMDTPKRKSAINERMEALVSAPLAVEDALVGLFDHSDHTLQRRVVETYVQRLYQPYCSRECQDAVAQI
ncbi:acetyl-coenzyme-A carboxylase [Datura stramonium]|uniref:Acetyl-coenzyme-A carboxylase n=1 Tax=Datura stramonium TaxID=4076 RepID=A0ABS8WIH3_DATST|nr:acetyl-coenzyme-A carboxylase [Datura stramonium]